LEEFTGHGKGRDIRSLSAVEEYGRFASGDNAGMVIVWSVYGCDAEYQTNSVEDAPTPQELFQRQEPDLLEFDLNEKTGRAALTKSGRARLAATWPSSKRRVWYGFGT
jgi:hypothetical protein